MDYDVEVTWNIAISGLCIVGEARHLGPAGRMARRSLQECGKDGLL